MNSIDQITTLEWTIQKSKFIGILYPLLSLEDIPNILENIKKQYRGATHYCYAYIYEQNKKCSDDGEPSGTAGLPMLNVIEKQNLNYILCIVVRYFGGIKLGAGGLTRAYSKTVQLVLQQTNIIHYEKGYLYEITFTYNNQSQIEYLLKDMDIIEKNYNENIVYRFIANNDFNIDIIKDYCLSHQKIKQTWKKST